MIELSPNFPTAHGILALAYQKQGRHEEAIAEFRKAVELSGRESVWLGPLGYGYAVAGRRSGALAILRELEDRSARREAQGGWIAWIAGLGQRAAVRLAQKRISRAWWHVAQRHPTLSVFRHAPQRPAILRPSPADGTPAVLLLGQNNGLFVSDHCEPNIWLMTLN